jgi:hypothetical protein
MCLSPQKLLVFCLLTPFVKLLNASPDNIRFLHIEAASRLIQQRGPRGFQSDFEKALLNAHAKDIVRFGPLKLSFSNCLQIIMTLLNSRTCFLEEDDWQRALCRTIDDSISSVKRSEALVSVLLCHAKIPGLFRDVDQLMVQHSSQRANQKKVTIYRINMLRQNLWAWHSKWSAQLETYDQSQSPAVSKPKKECEMPLEVLAIFLSCLIITNRLYATLNGIVGATLEVQTQNAANRMLELQAQAQLHSLQGDLFMSQAIAIARSALNTADEWKQALKGAGPIVDEDELIRPALFHEWSTRLGRRC